MTTPHQPTPTLDTTVPALILKIGHYPLHHGGVGAIRSLGRCGVEVYAVTEDRFTPAAVSRYLHERIVWPTTGSEEPAQLAEVLAGIGRRIGRPTVLIPTDDEAAVVVAEHAEILSEHFLFPTVREPGLVRTLASKKGLHQVCCDLGVPSPEAAFPDSREEVEELAAHGRFPLVAKNREAFRRRRSPAVGSSTVVGTPAELRALAREWVDPPGVVLQEYLPRRDAEDWIVHGYLDRRSVPALLCTAVKERSWPPHAGVTTCATTVWNPELAAMTVDLCKRVGFAGIIDLDWRYDRRDGRYKLLDFNPRAGAQFRLFETSAGVDVVRAQYLDLTGRPVPDAPCPDGRRFVVENLDLPARLAFRRSEYATPHRPARITGTALGWFAADDLAPLVPLLPRHVGPVVDHIRQRLRAPRHTVREETPWTLRS